MNRHYFVTGATGTVGSAVVERILREPDTQATILARAADISGQAT